MVDKKMFLQTNMKDCCGCGACVAACPVDCLRMIENNEGFLEPFSSPNIDCIKCGFCNKVCPVQQHNMDDKKMQWAYIGQNTDEAVRIESTSGGVFSAIGEYIISQGGIVYGAAFDSDLNVHHTCVNKIENLYKFRNSKYVQSYISPNIYREIKTLLDQGKIICFSGTPCQIAGLISFLNKKYSNLILVDVICRAVASPMIWKKYLEIHLTKKFDYIYFRKKHYGYKYSTMSLMFNTKEVYYNGVESDPMLRAFFDNICDRKSCYSCKFRQRYRQSDFTLSDCYDVRRWAKDFDDDHGATKICVHTTKGKHIIETLVSQLYLRAVEVNVDHMLMNIREMKYSVQEPPTRESFFYDAMLLDGKELFEKYYPITFTVRLKKLVRIALLTIGLYQKSRELWWKLSSFKERFNRTFVR